MNLLPTPDVDPLTPDQFATAAANRVTPYGEYLGAKLGDAIHGNSAAQWLREEATPLNFSAYDKGWLNNKTPAAPAISEQDFKASPDYRPGIEYDVGMTPERQRAKADEYDASAWRAQLAAKSDAGPLGQVGGFLASVAGGAPDILNFVPVLGEAAKGAMVARLGVIAGHAAHGAADALAGQALLGEPLRVQGEMSEGQTPSVGSVAMDLGLAALAGSIGGGVHGMLAGHERIAPTAPVAEPVAGVVGNGVDSELSAGVPEGVPGGVAGPAVGVPPAVPGAPRTAQYFSDTLNTFGGPVQHDAASFADVLNQHGDKFDPTDFRAFSRLTSGDIHLAPEFANMPAEAQAYAMLHERAHVLARDVKLTPVEREEATALSKRAWPAAWADDAGVKHVGSDRELAADAFAVMGTHDDAAAMAPNMAAKFDKLVAARKNPSLLTRAGDWWTGRNDEPTAHPLRDVAVKTEASGVSTLADAMNLASHQMERGEPTDVRSVLMSEPRIARQFDTPPPPVERVRTPLHEMSIEDADHELQAGRAYDEDSVAKVLGDREKAKQYLSAQRTYMGALSQGEAEHAQARMKELAGDKQAALDAIPEPPFHDEDSLRQLIRSREAVANIKDLSDEDIARGISASMERTNPKKLKEVMEGTRESPDDSISILHITAGMKELRDRGMSADEIGKRIVNSAVNAGASRKDAEEILSAFTGPKKGRGLPQPEAPAARVPRAITDNVIRPDRFATARPDPIRPALDPEAQPKVATAPKPLNAGTAAVEADYLPDAGARELATNEAARMLQTEPIGKEDRDAMAAAIEHEEKATKWGMAYESLVTCVASL